MSLILDGTTGVPVTTVTGTLPVANGGTGVATAIDYGYKNRIINGAMQVDQRNAAASQTVTAAAALAYTVDRWYAYCTGANVTGQQIAGTYASSKNRYQFTGAASVTTIGFGQRIEQANSYDLANTTATLSCYISNSLLTTVTWTAYYATTTADTFGSLASPTVTQISTGTFTVSGTRTQYTTNITVPSAATTGIQIVFTVGAQISGTWIIDSVQLEKGSTATSFDYRPYGTELALCQRYLPAFRGQLNASGTWAGYAISTTQAWYPIPFPVPTRIAPTGITVSGQTDWKSYSNVGGGIASTAIAFQGASVSNGIVIVTVASGLTAGNGSILNGTNAGTPTLLWTGCEL